MLISIAEDSNTVTIGRDCMISSGVSIIASDFHSVIDLNTGKRINYASGVSIVEHVWIGLNAIILKNSVIDNNVIIGAGPVVRGEFEQNCVISGNPCKKVKWEINWDRRRLLRIDTILFEIRRV